MIHRINSLIVIIVILGSIFALSFHYHIDAMCEVTMTSSPFYNNFGLERKNNIFTQMIDATRNIFLYMKPSHYELCDNFGTYAFAYDLYKISGGLPDKHESDRNVNLGILWVRCMDRYHQRVLLDYRLGLMYALQTCLVQANDVFTFLEPCFANRTMKEYDECLKFPIQT